MGGGGGQKHLPDEPLRDRVDEAHVGLHEEVLRAEVGAQQPAVLARAAAELEPLRHLAVAHLAPQLRLEARPRLAHALVLLCLPREDVDLVRREQRLGADAAHHRVQPLVAVVEAELRLLRARGILLRGDGGGARLRSSRGRQVAGKRAPRDVVG